MKLTPQIQAAIKSLKLKTKFLEGEYYPGAADEETRQRCEKRVNTFLDKCESLLTHGTTDNVLYAAATALEDQFEEENAEESEHVGEYISDFMRIVGLHNWTECV